jgi:ABC-type multidrug transport system fused ATPase/permease subunit
MGDGRGSVLSAGGQMRALTPNTRKPSALRDLPWLGWRTLRWAPGSTVVWAILIVVDTALTALTLWATRGTVDAVVAAVRGRGTFASAIWWFAIITGIQGGSRLASVLRPYVRERVRVRAGAAIQRDAIEETCRLPVEAFDVEETYDLIRRVGEGADSRGPDLIYEALGLVQQAPLIIVNAVFLGEIAVWLPFAAAAVEAAFIWQMISVGRRERAFDIDWTWQRRLTEYYASLLTTRAAAAEVRVFHLSQEVGRR